MVDLEAVKPYISFQLVISEGKLCEGAAQSGLLNLLVRLKCSLVGFVFKLVISRIYSLEHPKSACSLLVLAECEFMMTVHLDMFVFFVVYANVAA